MPDIPKINKVVADDMCIACGACVTACPAAVVEPAYSAERGAHEVRISSFDSCPGCPAPCESVCPSIDVDLQGLVGLNSMELDRQGPIRDIFVGFSPAHRDNGISSSGGVLRAMIEGALRTGHSVICLGATQAGYGPSLLERPEDLDRVPGSIYHSTSFVGAIELLEGAERPVVLVATPCQLEGMRKYVERAGGVWTKKTSLVLGLICGWMYSDHSIKAFARYSKLEGRIEDVTYRGEDEVGLLKIKTSQTFRSYERRKFSNFRDLIAYRSSFSSPLNRLRCRVCEDHVNVLADVAVGDAWLDRARGEKLSIVLTRTERGAAAVSRLRSAGELVLEEGGYRDLIESQSENLVFGQTARRFNTYLRRRGISTPRFEFGGLGNESGSTFLGRASFGVEMVLRATARKSNYSLFRFLYVLRNLQKLIRMRLNIGQRLRKLARNAK